MESSRFTPRHVVRGHLKGLRNRDYDDPDSDSTDADNPRTGTLDILAILTLYGVPVVLAGVCRVLDWELGSPDILLAGVSLLAGGFIASFAQLASWREKLSGREPDYEVSEQGLRDLVDASVAHVSMAIYGCVSLAGLLVIAGNYTTRTGAVGGWLAAVAYALGAYVALLITLIVPALYSAYTDVNNLDDGISGTSA